MGYFFIFSVFMARFFKVESNCYCGGGECPWWGQDCGGCINFVVNETSIEISEK